MWNLNASKKEEKESLITRKSHKFSVIFQNIKERIKNCKKEIEKLHMDSEKSTDLLVKKKNSIIYFWFIYLFI